MAEEILAAFTCTVCKLCCESEQSLKNHLGTHGEAPVSCMRCHLTFVNMYLLDYHRTSNMCRKQENVPPCPECLKSRGSCSLCNKNQIKHRQCNQCGKTFRFRRHYDKHMEGHERNNCRYCSALLTSRKELVLHMAEKHLIKFRETEYQCKFCDKQFVKRITLYNHYNVHANGQFVCLSCGMFLQTEEEYSSHKEKHNREKQWSCDRCQESFSRRQQYLVHMKGHEKYQCMACNENFAVEIKLLEHERNKHQLRRVKRKHECLSCGRGFSRPSLLEIHYRIHTGEKPLHCKPCDKSFRTPRGYFKHLSTSQHLNQQATTSPIKIFNCDMCDKSFNQKTILDKHKTRVHGLGATFTCNFCSYKTNCKENMKRHSALHTEKRQFVCEKCGAAFHALQALKDHGKHVHSQIRHFTCSQCGKSFKRNSGLNRHMASHSEHRPHVCDCGRSYKRASHLRRHKESVHNITIKPPKLLKLERDNSGALVSVTDKPKKSFNSTETQWQTTQEKGDSITPMFNTNLCQPSSSSDELATVIHDPQRDPFHSSVMHTIEVSYDMNTFTTPEPLTAVPNTDSQLVFSTPISVALDQTHAVLSLHSDPTHNAHQLEPLLHSDDRLKHTDNIFIHQEKHEASGPVLLDANVAMDSYISSETSTLMTSSNEASLVSDLHHPSSLLTLSTDPSAHRYDLQDNVTDCGTFFQPLETVRHKIATTLPSHTVNRCIEPAALENNPTSLTMLPDYLPHHYPFLNV